MLRIQWTCFRFAMCSWWEWCGVVTSISSPPWMVAAASAFNFHLFTLVQHRKERVSRNYCVKAEKDLIIILSPLHLWSHYKNTERKFVNKWAIKFTPSPKKICLWFSPSCVSSSSFSNFSHNLLDFPKVTIYRIQ